MQDILNKIIENRRIQISQCKQERPLKQLQAAVEQSLPTNHRSMREALAASSSGIIAEFKRRSPSKGWIHKDCKPETVVPAYAHSGATALSILTESTYFGGDNCFIPAVREQVPHTPILRKDFIIDEYQLYEARLMQADAVLLIAAALTPSETSRLTAQAHDLGLEVLLEVHGESELEQVEAGPDMVGVNNRHLGTFHTDVECSYRLISLLPEGVLPVSESGLSHPETVRELRRMGYRGFLIGEAFMREADPGIALQSFIREVEA
ncbi:MAG: indole-3-glycerol phosphate synthase TrpC [Clostridium sp.]|nr:indole-3-glycerol phosphate synthase TrpC [Clostridium sp.]